MAGCEDTEIDIIATGAAAETAAPSPPAAIGTDALALCGTATVSSANVPRPRNGNRTPRPRPNPGEDAMTDRTTKALLAAIAVGLWANIAGDWLKPEPVHAQDTRTLRELETIGERTLRELETIGESLRSIERELENGAISRSAQEIARALATESLTGTVRSIERAVDRIENGHCGNGAIC